MSYFYRDYDDNTNTDQNISGTEFIELVDACFQYSCEFSILIMREVLDKFLTSDPKPIRTGSTNYEDCWIALYYDCNQETKDFLLRIHPSMFPDDEAFYSEKSIWDLTFYRRDKSVFMWSETHEGVCALRPALNEDVSYIVAHKGWYWLDGDSWYIVHLEW